MTVPIRETVFPTSLTTNGTSISATTSAGVMAGDTLVFVMAESNFNAASFATPTATGGVGAWTKVIDGAPLSASFRMAAWTAEASADGAKTVTGHTTNASLLQAHLIVVAGPAAVDVSTAATGTGTSQSAGSVTTTADGALLIGVWHTRSASGTYSPPAGMTQIGTTTAGAFHYLMTAQKTQETAGSTGTQTATFTASQTYNAGLIAIKPVDPPPPFEPSYHQAANWLWNPIPPDPALDPDSEAISEALAGTPATDLHVALITDFAVTLRGPDGITAATPRFDVSFRHATSGDLEDWGPDPFGADTMPIPAATPVPGVGVEAADGHVGIADPTTNLVFNLWQAVDGGSSWSASWGAVAALDGDGRETGGSSTGAGLSRFACVIRESEIAAGLIQHALFFSTDMARAVEFRYPATKTDGDGSASTATIPEGARVQLDPAIDVESIPGITAAEVTIAKALQTYGAYCGDNGGARMAFLFEYAPESTVYSTAGLEWDYFDLTHIPWSGLRVLASWDGSVPPGSEPGRMLLADS